MSQQLLASKIVIVEESPNVRPIQGVPLGVTGMVGVTQRGRFGAFLCTSFDQYLKEFGSDTANGDVCTNARGFFGGGGSFLWVCRTVHYTDPTNPATKTSAAATGTLLTAALAATSGFVKSTNAGPTQLASGDTIIVSINGGGNITTTFTGVAAARTSAAAPFALSNGQTLTLTVNGGPVQTVTFLTSQFVSIGAATALEVAAVINASITGASASVATNQVTITTDRKGTTAALNITGGAANGALAFTTGSISGTGNVADIDAVTNTEAAALIDAQISATGTATVSGGFIMLASDTFGTASTIQVIASSTADTKFGFDNATHAGTNAGTLSTIRVDGKSDGTYANGLVPVVETATSGAAADFNFSIQSSGRVVESFPNLSMDPTNQRYFETIVNDDDAGSNLVVLTDLFAATQSPDNRPVNVSLTLTGGNDGLSSIADADYIGSPVPDEAAGTGIRALDIVEDLGILTVPGQATAGIHNSMVSYCEATRFGAVFPILDPPAGLSVSQMNTYVTSTASLKELSEFGAIYYPRVKVTNPNATIYGNVDSIVVPPSGFIAGTYARNDSASPGGVYEAPGGVDFGRLFTVIGLESDEVKDESKRDLLQPNHINPIVGIKGLPIHMDGVDTLKSTGPFPTIGERRGVIFIEQSLKKGLFFAKHRKIKPSLLSAINRTIRQFMLIQMRNDAFATNDPKTAFSIDTSPGLNPPSEAFARRVNARLGIATAKPAEWIILRVGQDTTALEEELAAAA
jgi:hypothetical protein